MRSSIARSIFASIASTLGDSFIHVSDIDYRSQCLLFVDCLRHRVS